MNFSLTAEQAAMVETARSFVKKAVAPRAAEYDRPGAPRPDDWMKKAAELGFTLMASPPEFGGVGAGTLTAGMVLEELAAGCAGLATAVMGGLAAAIVVQTTAPPGKARELLAPPAGNSGSTWPPALAGLPDGEFRLDPSGKISGEARAVIGAEKAPWLAVPVKDGEEAKWAVISPDSGGVAVETLSRPLGLRAAAPGTIKLDKAALKDSDIIGPRDTDAALAMVSPLLGCVAVGCARAALDEATDYARQRYQGGEFIIRHDAVAHLILTNRARIDAARASLRRAMAQNDAAINPETGALTGALHVSDSVLARCFATDAAAMAALDAVQCLGGYGYMNEFPVNKRMRDARSLGLLFGTNPQLMSRIKPRLQNN